jgi:7-cyano-7-deazaguanine reductase
MLEDELTLLGKTVNKPITKDELETFKAPDGVNEVTLSTDELTSLCPKTGQPDWYELNVTYAPDEKCLESKSFKLYLWQFRDTGQFIEQLANRIADELWEVLAPIGLKIAMKMKPRGGISITAEAIRVKSTEEVGDRILEMFLGGEGDDKQEADA